MKIISDSDLDKHRADEIGILALNANQVVTYLKYAYYIVKYICKLLIWLNIFVYYDYIQREGGGIMPRIRLITDLCSTHEISDICHVRQEPIFNTDNRNVDLEGTRIETYEVMANNATVDTAILEAEVEFERDGQLYDARETLAFLKKKHFG